MDTICVYYSRLHTDIAVRTGFCVMHEVDGKSNGGKAARLKEFAVVFLNAAERNASMLIYYAALAHWIGHKTIRTSVESAQSRITIAFRIRNHRVLPI